MDTNIFLQTAFAFMSCDGEIASEEIQIIKEMNAEGYFPDIDLDAELQTLVYVLNKEGKGFFKSYLSDVDKANLSKEDSLKLLKIAVKTIYADNVVEYSEVKFFRAMRFHLNSIDDDCILENIPEIEDFWLASDTHQNTDSVENDYFDSIEFSQFDVNTLKK